jgi:deoxyribodipyrimidine photolyase-related protein
MRRSHNVLIDDEGGPIGGSWSFDTENRKKLPRSLSPPEAMLTDWVRHNDGLDSGYVGALGGHGGDTVQPYPTTHEVRYRGWIAFSRHVYAVSATTRTRSTTATISGSHSLLSPLLNVGLLTPHIVVERTLEAASSEDGENALPSTRSRDFFAR